jgi:hypothetical protein
MCNREYRLISKKHETVTDEKHRLYTISLFSISRGFFLGDTWRYWVDI